MRFPKWRERSNRNLLDAAFWAQGKLYLQNWDILLFLEDAASRCPTLKAVVESDDLGAVFMDWGTLNAHVGLWLSRIKEDDEDPLKVLFHEMAHITLIGLDDSEEPVVRAVYDRQANRIASLLLQLWALEGRDDESEQPDEECEEPVSNG